ncbi:tripartite tricarboxylate transporter substrate binding protein [Ottowia sp. VDI28]|uniref:tripartite tricarboxylate transporter substrate binding protein n=1 Tax=Ottowia sp. VDI28 TaxID=3133968 RepID=UPI003C2E37CB
MISRRHALTLLAAALQLPVSNAIAQDFPDGTLRLIVPTTPGSTPDLLARTISPKLSARLGRTVVVENRTGASGNIGTEAVVRAAPNGGTFLIAASSLAMNGVLTNQPPFNAINDLAPVMLMGWNRLVFVTHPGSGIKTIEELVAAARKSPGKLTYGSPGNGTPNHLAAELFKVRTNTHLMHIPYRGSAQQLTDVLGGQIDMAPLTAIVTATHTRTGKLVPLAVTGNKRSPLLSEVPALSERGFDGIDGNIWYGMFAPRGTPSELINRMNAAVREALRESDAALSQQGFEVAGSPPEELHQLLMKDTDRWNKLIKQQGIKAE